MNGPRTSRPKRWTVAEPHAGAAELADRLSARFGGAQAFFCNSGAEAVEAALKYARKATGRHAVAALEGSFHGRTLGALAVTGQPAKRQAFEPLAGPVSFARPNDDKSLSPSVPLANSRRSATNESSRS